MKRTVYEAPVTELFRVELEGGFMSASVHEAGTRVETNAHEENLIDAGSFDGGSWNDRDWVNQN